MVVYAFSADLLVFDQTFGTYEICGALLILAVTLIMVAVKLK